MQLLLDADPEQLQQLMFLLSYVSPALQAELATLAAQDMALLARLLELTRAGDYWEDMLPLLFALSAADQRRLLALPVWQEQPELVEQLVRVADSEHLWLSLLPLCGLMPEALQQRCAGLIAALPNGIEHASRAALAGEYWDIWLRLLACMPEPRQDEFARLLHRYGTVDAGLQQRVARQAGPLAERLVADLPVG